MSKHQRHVRRERKKTDRARRLRVLGRHPTSDIRHGAAVLAAAAAIAAGTSAYAAPVRFDNPAHGEPGHYEWAGEVPPQPGQVQNWLDVMLPASEQTGAVGYDVLSSVGQRLKYSAPYGNIGTLLQNPSELQVDPSYSYFAVGVDSGAPIPTSGTDWQSNAVKSFFDYYPFGQSMIPENEASYLGLRFKYPHIPGDGSGFCTPGVDCHYAWIGVVRTAHELEAFAWGYETEVGVPIAAGVPEPGTLALLAVGAVGLAGRRSRRQRHDN